MQKELPKTYDPKKVEDDIYQTWEESGFFNPDNLPGDRKESFTISMPPPNATGQLHLGHSVMLAIEDIFTRFARMQGKDALWVPGTDHASIATEALVIKNLQQEGVTDPRSELGREKLIEKIAEFVDESRSTIRNQVKKMGSSCDWSRERYTLEPTLNRVVNEVFVKMYEDGLIYRGHRIVNWDPKMQTTVADDEIEWTEERDPFYYLQYGPFVIATSRPETKFGDKYVVMHPKDKRYKDYKHGDTFECEWINGPITATVIKDEAIDMELGSGVMTITPWHDGTDFEIAERHNLDKEPVIDFDGNLLPIAGEFEGMPIEQAREKIIEKLDKKNLLVKTDENYIHNVAISYRGKGKIEPQIKEQWFIDVNKPALSWKSKNMSLKEVMQDVVRSKDINIIPDRFEKIYFHWIDNLRDWCISRQIWWGHRIPVWYRRKSEVKNQKSNVKINESLHDDSLYIGAKSPEGDNWVQDEDTLDTWFSSALWTWSTLIDPEKAEDFSLSLEDFLEASPDVKRFHPTTIMETGYDILFFWVARMILMTTYATGEIPFKNVYLHGLIRTREGKKMSKSDPETMIDPLDMIDQFGTDALRLSMIVGQTPGNDSRLYKEKIAGYRNFVNKLWNISRFILTSVDVGAIHELPLHAQGNTLADRWILSRFETVKQSVTEHVENYRLSHAIQDLYDFTWGDLADWYLEIAKLQLKDDDTKKNTSSVLIYLLTDLLKLWHPFAPFITEHVFSLINNNDDLLIVAQWPELKKESKDKKAEEEFESLRSLVVAIRNFRAESKLNPKDKLDVYIEENSKEIVKVNSQMISTLARVNILDTKPQDGTTLHESGFDVSISIPHSPELEKRQEKERENLEKYINSLEKKLSNKSFTEKAPADVVEIEKKKLEEAKAKLEKNKI